MCGIASILHLDQHVFNEGHGRAQVPRIYIERMRDRLAHRGPDDAGLWEGKLGSIGHRRLSVIDPTPAGHQPMLSDDSRYILAYNGELYNDHDLRSQLATLGCSFKSSCDTETLLHALITWGEEAIDKIRGMYAFVFLDTKAHTAILARDPMGIKPLYHTVVNSSGQRQLLIASEIPAILEHPDVVRRPDPVTLSAYLSSVRTTLGERTMFENISTVTPGQWLTIRLDDPEQSTSTNWWTIADRTPTQSVRQTIEDSIHRHLRTDVPMCTLLSGGLDSAVTTLIAKRAVGELNTYCAGAKVEGFSDDFSFAASLSEELGTNHTEVEITQETFIERWKWMVSKLGVPLSTPNEVAIYEVAAALRSRGHVVAISGEGADELFAGYAPIMQQADAHIASLNGAEDIEGGLFHLSSNAWISDELKPGVLREPWFNAADSDRHLKSFYQDVFNEVRAQSPSDSPLQAHLRFQRRMNLPNLLQRLDTSTMLACVEGRTPYADTEVAICAESLPMSEKYIAGEPERTKIALRHCFEDELPENIINRPKASFPLPFQHWMEPMTDLLLHSPIAREFFTEQAIGLVCARPASYWHMAWPMINLTIWGESQFGENSAQKDESACCSKYSSSTT
jgi:asparagine synthase (glutamine-hydrolysing)